MKVRTQGLTVKMVVILVEEEKMREMLVVVVGVVDRSPSPTLPKGRESILAVFEEVGWNALPLGRVGEGLTQGAGVHSCCVLGGWVARPPLGEGWGGALGRLGWGLSALATPTELPRLVEDSLRTLTRSGRTTISPILTISTKRKECSLTALNTARRNSFPLGKVGMGPLFDALLGRALKN